MACRAPHHPPPPAASLIWPAREKKWQFKLSNIIFPAAHQAAPATAADGGHRRGCLMFAGAAVLYMSVDFKTLPDQGGHSSHEVRPQSDFMAGVAKSGIDHRQRTWRSTVPFGGCRGAQPFGLSPPCSRQKATANKPARCVVGGRTFLVPLHGGAVHGGTALRGGSAMTSPAICGCSGRTFLVPLHGGAAHGGTALWGGTAMTSPAICGCSCFIYVWRGMVTALFIIKLLLSA